MIEKIELFPTILYKKKLELDNRHMCNRLYSLRSSQNYYIKDSNPWQSGRDLQNDVDFNDLTVEIKKSMSEFFISGCNILQMWGSIYETGQYNNIHNHPPLNASYYANPLWVGVYYLKTENNTGGLNIHSPVNVSNKETLYPEPGDLYIFNSTTYHSVHPNQSTEDRISVAFNLELIDG
jgi:hypothetical protein